MVGFSEAKETQVLNFLEGAVCEGVTNREASQGFTFPLTSFSYPHFQI